MTDTHRDGREDSKVDSVDAGDPSLIGSPPAGEPPYPSPTYAWYVVGVLMLIYVFSFVDRQILGLLVGPIKRDLDISDSQMSYLMGLSFAVFYTVFGMPMGRLADSSSRRGLIAAGLFVWSLMTASCGLATRYWHFLLLRIGVGVGEATLSPAAYSLISDMFPKRKLGTALSVYGMGIYIGSGLAFICGGLIVRWLGDRPTLVVPIAGEIRSWQIVFLALGLPGIAFTAILLTVKEPYRRGLGRSKSGVKPAGLPLGEVVAYIKRNWFTFFCHNVGFGVLSLSSYGAAAWIPTFFNRTYGMSTANAGMIYGVLVVSFGSLGIYTGGWLADRLQSRGVSAAKMRVSAVAAVVWVVGGCVFPLAPNQTVAFIFAAPSIFFAAMPVGLAAASIQEMMPNPMRGQASAVYLFVNNLIGLGIGPSAIAWVTDYGFNDESKLRYSLLIVTVVAHVISTILFIVGVRPFIRSVAMCKEWEANAAASRSEPTGETV